MEEIKVVNSLQVMPLYFVIALIGVWIIADGIVSLISYKCGGIYKDTWLKIVRICMGISLIVAGVYLGL